MVICIKGSKTDGTNLFIGDNLIIRCMRTLRVPEDGKAYPLPPGLGTFPLFRTLDFRDRAPKAWSLEEDEYFLPIYQREALWLSFESRTGKPSAVKVATGGIDAITGRRWRSLLNRKRQNYVVIPEQPWLDGFNTGNGTIKQFVAMPLGMGYTIEGQVTGRELRGGIHLQVFDMKVSMVPRDTRHRYQIDTHDDLEIHTCNEMGLAAGGTIDQDIYPDPYGYRSWDTLNYTDVRIHLVNSADFRMITGVDPPTTPVTAAEYSRFGFPWFDLYDEGKGDITPSPELARVKTVSQIDTAKGFTPQQDDTPVVIPPEQVSKIEL